VIRELALDLVLGLAIVDVVNYVVFLDTDEVVVRNVAIIVGMGVDLDLARVICKVLQISMNHKNLG